MQWPRTSCTGMTEAGELSCIYYIKSLMSDQYMYTVPIRRYADMRVLHHVNSLKPPGTCF